MTKFTVYDLDGGRILRVGSAPNQLSAEKQAANGEGVLLQSANEEEHYVDGGDLADRPELGIPTSLDLTIDEIHPLPGVPAASQIRVDGVLAGVSTGDDVELVFELDGEYIVDIDAPWPHRPASILVTVSL